MGKEGIVHYAHVPGDELDESAKTHSNKGPDPQQIILHQVASPSEERRLGRKSVTPEGRDGLWLKICAEPSKRDGFSSPFWLNVPMILTSNKSLHLLPPQCPIC